MEILGLSLFNAKIEFQSEFLLVSAKPCSEKYFFFVYTSIFWETIPYRNLQCTLTL